jgi:class 3 adenylate cyclase
LILIVEDNPTNLDILKTRLLAHDYDVITAADGEAGLATAIEQRPDLVLLDIMMPKMDGLEVCRRLKGDASLPFMPVIIVTAKADSKDVVAGLEAGSEDYLTKPIDHAALIARVRSMLRVKDLHDTVQEQATRLQEQATELEEWNQKLEHRVAAQMAELEKVGHLKRFLSPQLAEIVLSSKSGDLLKSHRRDITVVFCDLRGFTAFSGTGEPEEVMGVLREYHEAMGALIFRFEGTLERFTGDGLMVVFNDPIPCEDPSVRGVKMAVAMRERMAALGQKWHMFGHELGFGVGIAQGYATLGEIGFEGRLDYTAIGTVTNLASRLCDKAESGQILVSQRVFTEVEDLVTAEPLEELDLKGIKSSIMAYNILNLNNNPSTTTK